MKKLNIAVGVASVGLAALAAKIPVDFSQELGPVKRLNGMVNTAPIALTLYPEKDMLSATKELEIPCTRFHDASLESPGYDLIDVTRVFPLFHLDPDDERNYNFAATDDMLARCRETGSDIEYRLGESIEHSARQYKVHAPKDFAKWAEICVHIIRHYNEGWANGFRWNIRRWSIWEEPDTNPMLLTGAPNPGDEDRRRARPRRHDADGRFGHSDHAEGRRPPGLGEGDRPRAGLRGVGGLEVGREVRQADALPQPRRQHGLADRGENRRLTVRVHSPRRLWRGEWTRTRERFGIIQPCSTDAKTSWTTWPGCGRSGRLLL